MFQSRSESETKKIGKRLAGKLGRGDVVCLFGELGAGKTTMVKGMAEGMGIDEKDITSPSFTIIAEHQGKIPLYHIDLYRLDREDVGALGLNEYIYGDGISVIEWAERAGDEVPEDSIKVMITYTDDNLRDIDIEGVSI
jgi:tRNA threonylcarbamoyladenosine biosynthesis protein TsaE